MDIHIEDVIISIINIIILFVLLRLILWKHVIRFLAERSDRIGQQFADAEVKEQQADVLSAQFESKLAGLKQRDLDLLTAAKAKAFKEADLILEKAQSDAAVLISDAKNHIAVEKAQALEDVHDEVARLAANMASQILHREVSASDNEGVVEEFFS